MNRVIVRYFWMMVVGFLLAPFLTSCDEHEPVDLDIHPGYILCADGSIMSEDAYYSQNSTKACAIVFTEKSSAGHYLAVSVKGAGNGQFCDTLGVALGTSCSVEDIDGFTNTTAMQNTLEVLNSNLVKNGKSNRQSIALQPFSSHRYGQSEYIPSVMEMRELYSRISIVKGVLSRLADHGDNVFPIATDEGRSGNCWYWTSTEVEENQGRQAWLFSLNSGGYIATPVNEYHDFLRFVAIYY